MRHARQRLISLAPALLSLVLAAWSASLGRDGAALQPHGRDTLGDEAGLTTATAESKSVPSVHNASPSFAPVEGVEKAELSAQPGGVFGGRFGAEAIDPDWAPQMAATLDSVVRSLGRTTRDVRVECRTTACRAVILHYPSFFAMDESARNDVLISLVGDLRKVMGPGVEASLGLDEFSAFGLVELSPDKPLGSLPPEEAYGTAFYFTRASRRDESEGSGAIRN